MVLEHPEYGSYPGAPHFHGVSATFRSEAASLRFNHAAYQELMAKLRGPGNGLGDIYQIDIGELKIKK
jgi:hypothetical protein